MSLIASSYYDPATYASVSLTAYTALAAFDTTNSRVTFTAPASGTVVARIVVNGAATNPPSSVVLGILDGSTVVARQIAPCPYAYTSGGYQLHEVVFVITGLTGGNSYTWDSAWGCTYWQGGTLRYGGPDNTSIGDANGPLIFEIWEAPNLLAALAYDPATAATAAANATKVMTAFDTTNARLTFTAPASGNVMVRVGVDVYGSFNPPSVMLGVLDGSTVIAKIGAMTAWSVNGQTHNPLEVTFVVTGLTGGNSYTWDAAYGIDRGQSSANLKWGGTTGTPASGEQVYGPLRFEVWAA